MHGGIAYPLSGGLSSNGEKNGNEDRPGAHQSTHFSKTRGEHSNKYLHFTLLYITFCANMFKCSNDVRR